MKKSLMHIDNARVEAQKKQMEEIAKLGICPFCREYFEIHHKAPILKETLHWILTKNDYPYEGTKVHLLLVHKKHIENPGEMSPAASKELPTIISWAKEQFDIRGGTFIMRFGDMRYTGATISHLHGHIISGVKQSLDTESIKQKIGFKKK